MAQSQRDSLSEKLNMIATGAGLNLDREETTYAGLQQVGRASNYPIHYTEEIGLEVLHALANDRRAVNKICSQNPRFPHASTLYDWRRKFPEFAELYEYAMQMRAHTLMDDCHSLADDVDPDHQFGSARVSKAKLQIAIRSRYAEVYDPATFGKVLSAKLSGNVGVTYQDLVEAATAEEVEKGVE